MYRTQCSLVILGLLVACGDGPAGSDAGDSGADATDTGLIASPPDIPWLDMGAPPIAEPLLTPCPAGWSEVVREDGPVTCHPYGGEPDVCPDGSAHFVGDAACTPVGAPCPTGDFPEELPTDVEVLYVLSSAPAGGDGSEGSPLMTITDALNVASRGTVVAIGKGSYDEALRVGPGITLWGACARETRVTASSPGSFVQGIVTVPSADVQLKNLSVGPANLSGVVVFGTRASVSIDGLLIDGTQKYGLIVNNGAHLEGRELSISGTRSDATGRFGRGLVAEVDSVVELSRVFLSRNHEIGVFVNGDGTSLTLSDVVVEDTQERASDGAGGQGLNVQSGAAVAVTRALISGNRSLGVFVEGDGTSLTLSDVVVEDTQERASDGAGGRGLNVQSGATVEVTRALISGSRDLGVFVNGDGTSLTLSDVVVEDTQERASDGTGGQGLNAQSGATVEVTRALISGNREFGVLAAGSGTSVRLSDVVVGPTDEQACAPTTCADSPYGVGLAGVSQANLVAIRFEALDSALCGVLVQDDGQVDLSLGQVSGSPIGVCLQADDYAIARLTESVRYVDNGTNLDATSLPVPEPASPFDPTE